MKKEFPKNFVTIYTDATLSGDGHHAYAFWAKAEWGTLQLAKMCPDEISGIGQAELYAICQGMWKALTKWKEYGIVGFYIRSDSKHALSRIENPDRTITSKHSPIPEVERRLMLAFKKMRDENNLTMNLRHVKGHGSGRDIRSYLNNWCDKKSREAISKHRTLSVTP